MAIVNYPTRIFKTSKPAIDVVSAVSNPKSFAGHQDLNTGSLDDTLSVPSDWKMNSISFEFSNTTSRAYTLSVASGRNVIEKMNDYLWFQVTGAAPQRIVLDPGAYTGTTLATELQTKMDANVAYTAAGITFTVVYDSNTGFYTITPSSGTIRYLDTNTQQTIPYYQSIAGHLFGLTVNGSLAATAVSDKTVFGLDTEAAIISETADVSLTRYIDDVHTFSEDQFLHLVANTGPAITMDYVIVYEQI